MAQLAVSLAGAGIGYAIGGPAGAKWGWMAGSILGSILFPTKLPGQEGPRLGDLSVTSSTYGQSIPKTWGTSRVSGNIIWATKIEEVSTTTSQSQGGKGGSSQSATTYTYFASFALGLAEGTKQAATRMWADGKLIYDTTSTSTVVLLKGLKFRFYKGDEIQLPDSLIEADKGVGNVSAHRGLCYIVFERLPLANFGNRIPNITVELSSSPTVSYLSTGFTNVVATSFYSTYSGGYDSTRKIVFGDPNGIGSPQTGILNSFQVPGMIQTGQTSVNPMTNFSAALIAAGEATSLTVQAGTAALLTVDRYTGSIFRAATYSIPFPFDSSDPHVLKYSPSSLIVTQVFPPDFDGTREISTHPINSSTVYRPTLFACAATVVSDAGSGSVLVTVGKDAVTGLAICAGVLNIDSMTNIGFENYLPGLVMKPVPGLQSLGSTDVYIPTMQVGAASIIFNKVNVTLGTAAFGTAFTLTAAALGGSVFTDINRFLGYSDIHGFVYDPDTNSIIGQIKCSGTAYVVSIDATSGAINWKSTAVDNTGAVVTTMQTAFEPYVDMAKSSIYMAYGNSCFLRFDKYKGTALTPIPFASFNHFPLFSNGGILAYDPQLNAVLTVPIGGTPVAIYYLDKLTSGTVTLESIVQDLSAAAGLTPAELTTTDLSSIAVRGYLVAQQCSVRDAITPLSTAYFFDGIESDGTVKFLTRGRSVAKTLTQENLGAAPRGSSDFWNQTHGQEQDLPLAVNVAYLDFDRDYQQGTQYGKRVATPTPVMFSKNVTTVGLPIVMVGSEAKQIANKLLYTSWVERDTYQSSLPWSYINLDPADVIQVNLDNGASYKVNLTAVNIGADLTLAIQAMGEDTTTYSATVVAENHYVPAVLQTGDNSTVLQIYNVPLLSDLHDQLRTKSIVYYQVSPLFTTASWSGCNIYTSYDTVNWSYQSRLTSGMIYGHVSNTLGAPAAVNAIDYVNTLTVWPVANGADLVSITTAELFAGSHNMVIVGSEVINFQTVTNNGDGSYKLSNLLRGRRGTDTKASSHVVNENFYFIDVNTTSSILVPLTKIGVPIYLKAVGDGLTLEEVPAITFTPTGEDLKPYAPVNASRLANTPGAGDIRISWNRRTRINGDLYPGDAIVPLNEDTESYSIDILSGHNGSVLRTLTSVVEHVDYLSANVVTDFGAPPATLYCRVYQISGEVGRGYSYEFALT